MKYKNIVFDFGNVIGRFDGKAILSEFCPYEEELDYLSEIVYKRWAELDAGTLDMIVTKMKSSIRFRNI